MHHPWRELRDRGDGVVVHFTRFTDGRIAATDGTSAIWIDDRLDRIERRCVVQHEQAHIDLGHTSHATPKQELAARRLTAQTLIDWDDLVDVFRWASNAHDAAEELQVVPEVLEDRLHFLTPTERALLAMIGAQRYG